ncbi:helix-turn-helix domain-containing protein [Phaeocystidibacter luteus]|uniref:AAA family ATPase n=1 Tax=Phaeocystidibacter luteus TaxID=911197 RepID=A0A6N6RE18_9FLAO|nr:helix-turn-helix domain-containing protein [Phaeocystidibacter luteus]KAB2808034.1 AAA family ATPase [Phaeocystidibacter luteus]
MSKNDPIQVAAAFVNRTARNIFLTGKAGTGKTTFLRDLAEHTHKNYMIVAPTGIAALNAGGATIHSQFSLPFGTYIPDSNFRMSADQNQGFYTRNILISHHRLSKVKRLVLRSLELLIIDEVSMLRADILDAIDLRLKSAKNIWDQPFGGVQLLFIGDLFQLPPIVKDHERSLMHRYYPNANFFNSLALKQSGLIYVELTKIYRQSDDVFIDVLNNLRQNRITAADREILNSHYLPEEEHPEGVITLATHNRLVDDINQNSLAELEGESHFYRAKIEGDFSESMYPCSREIELKIGAQVMFIRNDSSQDKRYYNGKLAKVVGLEEDEITVVLEGEEDEFLVPKETWENAKYTVEDDSLSPQLDVVGTFQQFPLKLAWAVTIHKSQGLTFDRAVIDVGRAFAPGQVYVALSRLRSLDGLILRTPVPLSAVQSDPDIVHFSEEKRKSANHVQDLKTGQKQYMQLLLNEAFDLMPIARLVGKSIERWPRPLPFDVERVAKWPDEWVSKVGELIQIGARFRSQLNSLLNASEEDQLFERLTKGVEYFESELKTILVSLFGFRADLAAFSGTKKMINELDELDHEFMQKWRRIDEIIHRCEALLAGKVIEKNTKSEKAITNWRIEQITAQKARAAEDKALRTGKRVRSKSKARGGKKVSTFEETFSLYEEGLSIAQIAEKRELTETTIVGHLARGISIERVDFMKLLPPAKAEEILRSYKGQDGLSDWRKDVDNAFSYQELRLALAHIKLKK